MQSVTVVIVHWNTSDILKKQIEKLTPARHITYVVVDNNSKESLSWLRRYKHVKLVRSQTNLGFAKACNLGAKRYDKSDWLLFLNPDTFLTRRAIDDFVNKAMRKRLDAASPRSTARYSKPLPTWWNLATEFTPLKRIFRQKHVPSQDTKTTLFGGCLLIKRTTFIKIGGWDGSFFLWFEDSDLSKRLYDSGYKVGRVEVEHTHIGGSSFKLLTDKKQREMFFSSMRHYAQKHFSWWGRLVVKVIYYRYT